MTGSASRRRPGGPLVVAIDVGSSSVRAALYDERGTAHRGAFAQVRYAPDVDRHGSVSVPADRLLDVLVETIDRLTRAAGADLSRTVGVGTSCFLHSMAGLDAAGRAVTPLLTWADTTSAAAAEELKGRLDQAALWQETGAPLHASYWPAKIVNIRRRFGQGVRGFAGAPELLWRSLTDAWGTDLSHASGTGLLDRRSGRWHASLLENLAILPDALPAIRPLHAAAPLAPWAAARWPALAGVPWFAPWSDASCGNVGLGGWPGGPAGLQIGTSGALRVMLAEGVPAVPQGLFAHRLGDGSSLLGGQLSEGGGTAAAVARLLGSRPSRLEPEAASLPPDGHGLTVLPYLAGERGPGYHGDARGIIAGLSLATSPAELYLATVESIAMRFAALDRRLTAHLGSAPAIVASGGALASSRLLPGVLAAALGRPIGLSSEGEASARGAALQTLAAVGVIGSPADVPPPPAVSIDPEPERVAAYAVAAPRQEALYRASLTDG